MSPTDTNIDPRDKHPAGAQLFRWVDRDSGVLHWPEIARYDDARNILFIDREVYERSDDTTRNSIKRCRSVMEYV